MENPSFLIRGIHEIRGRIPLFAACRSAPSASLREEIHQKNRSLAEKAGRRRR
jgi:hypothetical protein